MLKLNVELVRRTARARMRTLSAPMDLTQASTSRLRVRLLRSAHCEEWFSFNTAFPCAVLRERHQMGGERPGHGSEEGGDFNIRHSTFPLTVAIAGLPVDAQLASRRRRNHSLPITHFSYSPDGSSRTNRDGSMSTSIPPRSRAITGKTRYNS